MAKRSDTLETVLLAVELLRRIPRGRKVTASELHQQLKHAGMERELRTIQRQLEMLSEHFEIERDDSSKPYGYRWLEQARALAVPNLTPQESLLLQLAQEHLKNLLPPRLMKSMDAFFSQARRNLGQVTEVSTLTFERPKTFDLKRYDDDGRFGFGEGEKVLLVFRIERSAGLHLMESPLSTDQQVVERKDGQLEISATVVDSAMLNWWLRGFGDSVTSIEKTELTFKGPGG